MNLQELKAKFIGNIEEEEKLVETLMEVTLNIASILAIQPPIANSDLNSLTLDFYSKSIFNYRGVFIFSCYWFELAIHKVILYYLKLSFFCEKRVQNWRLCEYCLMKKDFHFEK